MSAFISRLISTEANWATVPLRFALGLVFMGHGAQKLFGWFGGYGLEGTAGFFSQQLGLEPGIVWAALAGSGEFFGGLLVLMGLFTRFGALNLAVTMLVALVKVHSGAFFLPSGMEYVLTLLAASLALILWGGGQASVDRALMRHVRS